MKTPKLRSMRGLLAGAGLHSSPAPKPPAIPKVPKPPKLPKISSVSVTHHFQGAPSKQFTFKRPSDLATHIKKVQNSEWMHPNVDRSAVKIDKLADIG